MTPSERVEFLRMRAEIALETLKSLQQINLFHETSNKLRDAAVETIMEYLGKSQ